MTSHDVFISYSSKDKTTADAICALLERDGAKCWIAPRDILPGEAWEPSIVRAIGAAKVFVLLYSGASNESAQVRREVSRAASGELPIIPFRIADVPPNETFEFYISSQHWMDALDPPLQRHIERLSSVVRRLLGRDEETNASGAVDPVTTPHPPSTAADATEAASPAQRPAPDFAGPPKRTVRTPALLAGAGVLLALLVVAAVFLHPYRPNETSNPLDRTSADQLAPQGAYVLAFTLIGHTNEVRSVAFSPDGKRIVSGSGDKTLRIWDSATGQQIGAPLTGHTNWVNSVAFSPDGKRIVSGAGDKTLRIWDAAIGQEIGPPLTGHADRVFAVAFSPDGRRIVSGSGDKTLRIWDATTYQEIGPPLTGHTGVVLSVVYSPDGRRIVSGSQDKTIRIWDAATGNEIGPPIKGSPDQVLSVAFSPDGRRIVSGSLDNTIRIWDAATGQEIGEPLSGHTSDVNSVAFSPDGRRIVSGSSDDTVRVWDATTYQEIGPPLTGHTSAVNSVAWSPDGRLLGGASADKTVRVWKVSEP